MLFNRSTGITSSYHQLRRVRAISQDLQSYRQTLRWESGKKQSQYASSMQHTALLCKHLMLLSERGRIRLDSPAAKLNSTSS